jgi:hypothetical protein
MTAILGLNCLDSILMLADTEESLGRDAKSECDKLFRFPFPVKSPTANTGTILTGGAGDTHLIEYVNQKLTRLFSKGITPKTDLFTTLDSFARECFEDSMRGYQGSQLEPPTMEMLIAISIRPQTWLFHWSGNSVILIPAYVHTAIGGGITQLHPMLRDIQFSGTTESMLFLGVRMMRHAKRTVNGVGGKTEAVALFNDGATHFFGTTATQKIEELGENLDYFINMEIYTSVFNVAGDVKDLDKNVKENLGRFPAIMGTYREAYRKILTPSIG